MEGRCIAHIRIDPKGNRHIQSAADHCRAAARYAAEEMAQIGLGQTAYLAGLIHDMGKFTQRFADYISRATAGEPVRRGEVNHTFAAVQFLLIRYHGEGCRSFRDIACEVLAFAVGSHHGQFDCIDEQGRDGFAHRSGAKEICYEEAVGNFCDQCASQEELDRLFDQAAAELETLIAACKGTAQRPEELDFYTSLLCRLVLSAVIEGDRRDTAEFMEDFSFPAPPPNLQQVWRERLARLEERLAALPADSGVNRARRSISDSCGAFARHESGVFRLAVPTGAGKTLAALRFGLAHAAQQQKKHIVFAVPLLSVIDQNARVLRDYLEDDSLILEHHSNVVQTAEGSGELDVNELLTENWDAPVIITTLVQLLNTLFLGKPSSIRRLHALCNSVIVIDEVQSVPRNMLSLFNLAINFLYRVCHATVVLCSATQPCLEEAPHKLQYSRPDFELVPYEPALWLPFRRTEICDSRRPGGYTMEQLGEFATQRLRTANSLLIICNTKGQAQQLFRLLQGGDSACYHLSTAMCMRHRMDTLAEINGCLADGRRVVCVATQLVEAGVDFSFETVIRISAGMDNVVQAAGRCNRSGEFGRICPVYIVNVRGENLSRLAEIRQAQIAAEELLSAYERDSAAFGGQLTSDEAIRYYYRRLFFNMKDGAQDYWLDRLDTSLFRLLSNNRDFGVHCADWGTHFVNQAFRTAGEQFRVFEDNTIDVLVPYQKGADIIAELYSQKAGQNLGYRKALLEQAKPYTVSLYAYQKKRLEENGGLYPLEQETFFSVLPEFYRDTGIDP